MTTKQPTLTNTIKYMINGSTLHLLRITIEKKNIIRGLVGEHSHGDKKRGLLLWYCYEVDIPYKLSLERGAIFPLQLSIRTLIQKY